MRTLTRVAVCSVIVIGLAGCSDLKRWEQRALTGGAIGAAAGAGTAYIVGGPVAGAALVGAAAGAAIGGLTSDDDVSLNRKK